ncbi:MAG: HNH endonuclease [Nitrosopumilus sp. B06]|nr:MAG: HNH endonuclease [Nitrosopumilus sp. B06]
MHCTPDIHRCVVLDHPILVPQLITFRFFSVIPPTFLFRVVSRKNMDADTEKELEAAFLNILDQGSRDNTYKFAFARFLLDYEGPETRVSFKTIAKYFFQYYWFQQMNARLRQLPHATGWLDATRSIKMRFPSGYYPHTSQEIIEERPKTVDECTVLIADECFHDVTWRFQKLRYSRAVTEKRLFYNYKVSKVESPTKKVINLSHGIELKPGIIEFFKRNKESLYPAVTLAWMRFLEPLNPGVPRISRKIEGAIPRRQHSSTKRKILEEYFDSCFYCNSQLKTRDDTHVNHLIPYEFAADDKMWNLVLACKVCNAVKSGSQE